MQTIRPLRTSRSLMTPQQHAPDRRSHMRKCKTHAGERERRRHHVAREQHKIGEKRRLPRGIRHAPTLNKARARLTQQHAYVAETHCRCRGLRRDTQLQIPGSGDHRHHGHAHGERAPVSLTGGGDECGDDSACRHAGLLHAHGRGARLAREPHEDASRGRGIDEGIAATANREPQCRRRKPSRTRKHQQPNRQQKTRADQHGAEPEPISQPARGQRERERGTVVRRDHEAEPGVPETERFLDRWRQRDDERDVRGADRVRDEQRRDSRDRSDYGIALTQPFIRIVRHDLGACRTCFRACDGGALGAVQGTSPKAYEMYGEGE